MLLAIKVPMLCRALSFRRFVLEIEIWRNQWMRIVCDWICCCTRCRCHWHRLPVPSFSSPLILPAPSISAGREFEFLARFSATFPVRELISLSQASCHGTKSYEISLTFCSRPMTTQSHSLTCFFVLKEVVY